MFDHLQTCLLDITLPFDLKNGNDGQGKGWQRSDSVRKRFMKSTQIPIREPFNVPVFLVVTRILGKGQHMMDFDNINRGDWKQLQDSLALEKGWFYDDTSKHITGIMFRQDESRRHDGPAVRIQVWQSGCDSVPKSNRRTVKSGKRRSKASTGGNRKVHPRGRKSATRS